MKATFAAIALLMATSAPVFADELLETYSAYIGEDAHSEDMGGSQVIVLEDVTNQGRIDMAVRFGGHVYLFEFKVVELVPEGKALQQLQDRNYAEKYRALGQPIHLVGVEFSQDSRNIVAFDVLTLDNAASLPPS